MRVATRGSELALRQASLVSEALTLAHPGLSVEMIVVTTSGDRRLDVAIWEVGGQGVFVKEVQAMVLDRRADIAVHSAKDLPSATAEGLVLACVPERDDPRDALVGSTLAELPPGARVATGSVRRRAQLAWLRPDLTFAELRGNIATRLAQAGDHQAIVVAAAALRRLGLSQVAAEVLDPAIMLPQVGQGALAVECRADDEATAGLLATIDQPGAHRALDAERAFLALVGGGCDLPVGAHATERPGGVMTVDAMLANVDGRVMLRAQQAGPATAGAQLGTELAEYLLYESGGAALLAELYVEPGARVDAGVG